MRLLGYMLLPLLLMAACSGPKVISSSGLPYAQLGESMPASGLASLGGRQVRDTLFQEGGYQWRAAIVDYGSKGKVYLEDGFWAEGKVNRIRVESAKFHVKGAEKIAVGMPWQELQPQGQGWQMVYLPDYGLVDVFSDSFPRMHFLIRESRLSPEALKNPAIQADSLSPDAAIRAIVLM